MNLAILFSFFFLLLGIRTALWHLQNWQIREYRWDRLKAYFTTREGVKNLVNLWFFRGVLPRPRKSGRVFMILGIFIFLSGYIFFNGRDVAMLRPYKIDSIVLILIWERTIWLTVGISVFLSKLPVWLAQKIIFRKAKNIIDHSKNITRIGITGSYGKSSTKEILVHLLTSKFGKENVLFNPENQNNEVAIARLVLKNKKFFENPPLTPPFSKGEDKDKNIKKMFFFVEIGAYKRGEIRGVCDFIQPHIGILTGINSQHISLFGSQKNIQRAKFELAESASEKVFFNASSPLLQEIFDDRDIYATKIPLSSASIKDTKAEQNKTEFSLYGEHMTLPWGGEFFIQNALLAAETARELGLTPKEIKTSLAQLPPLTRALTVESHRSGAMILYDLYSANPDGVLSAIDHLRRVKGKKIFIGMPLLELGKESKNVHERIFKSLAEAGAEVFWLKKDHAQLGQGICGKRFHGHDTKALKTMIKRLQKDDAILLESRLPEYVIQLFS
ncbi:hypothetical protein K9L63_00910 [Candidatus Gracilibacteria bacterium]|nr:hypothetical protein [Candidatus Gracilibacteria bacterium]